MMTMNAKIRNHRQPKEKTIMANNPDPASAFVAFLAQAQSPHETAEPTGEPKPPQGNYVPREGTNFAPPPPNAVQQFAGWLQSAIDSVPDPHY
jgi:hypothetical protein